MFTIYIYIINICKMDEEVRKQMSSTNKKCTFSIRKEKIFNVRKLNYKQCDPNDKCKYKYNLDMKPQFSPFQVKDNIYEPATRIK